MIIELINVLINVMIIELINVLDILNQIKYTGSLDSFWDISD